MKKIFLFAFVIAAVFFVISGLSKNKSRESRFSIPHIDTTCVRNSAPIPQHIMGINLGGDTPNVVAELKGLGISWVRTDARWDAIEQQEGVYNWAQRDAGVLLAAKENLTFTVVIGHAPMWASTLSDADFAKASARFAQVLVSRYKPNGALSKEANLNGYGISYWEVSNEPNLPGYGWGARRDNPKKLLARYAETLARTSEAIRAADQNAHIILAGLSSDGMPAADFLDVLYRGGVSACFDIVAFHPYGYETKFAAAYKLIHDVFVKNGDAGVPVWFNEYGTTDDSRREAVLRDAMTQRNIPDALFWFSLVDYNQSDGHYGLIRGDGTQKPEYAVFKTLLQGN